MSKLLKQTVIVFSLMILGLLAFNIVPALAQTGTGVGVGAPEAISNRDMPEVIGSLTGGETSVRDLARTILNFLLGFLGFVAVLMIIYGGFTYVTAAGEEQKLGEAKKIIMYAIVGVIVILLSFAIVNTVLKGAGTGQDTGV